MSREPQSLQTSLAEVWNLKFIQFDAGEIKRGVKIITQNFNGPCSFIAICNILILRGDIELLPPERTTVSYELLSQLVGEYILKRCPGIDISAALSIMPLTQKGMDLNPLFTSATSFQPAGAGGELKLFEQTGIQLVHGWLVDPNSYEARTLMKTPDYDSAVNLIAGADHTTHGRLLVHDADQVDPESPTVKNWTDEERTKVEDAMIVRAFLNNTQSQLTYHGLFNLASLLEPGALVALFRNSHLSVLFKSKGDDASLYTLVTDHVFLGEPSVVWERMEDVDGGWASFVDSDFIRSSPIGGDFAGQTAEAMLNNIEGYVDPADHALAQQLQAEEDAIARQLYIRQEREEQERQRGKRGSHEDGEQRKVGKKRSCIIM